MKDGNYISEMEIMKSEHGFKGTYTYDTALIRVSQDGRAVYDYNLMVEWLIAEEGFENDEEAKEWLDYNAPSSIPYYGTAAPIVFFAKYNKEQSVKEFLKDHCLKGLGLMEGLDEGFLGISSSDSLVYDFEVSESLISGITNEDHSSWEAPPIFVKKLD